LVLTVTWLYHTNGVLMGNISVIVKILCVRADSGYQEYLQEFFFVELVFFTDDQFTSANTKIAYLRLIITFRRTHSRK